MPRFEIVKVPPFTSAGRSRPSRAAATSSARRAATASSSSLSTPRTTGTTRPSSTATAIPMLTSSSRTTPPLRQQALMSECSRNAAPQSFRSKSVAVTNDPRSRPSARRLSSAVALTSRIRKKWGAVCQLAVTRSAIRSQTRPRARPPTGDPAPPAAVAASAASTSAATIVPRGPVPDSEASARRCSCASRRAFGDASRRASPTARVALSRPASRAPAGGE